MADKNTYQRGESIFRICAYGLTGLQCTFYCLILMLLEISIFYFLNPFFIHKTIYSENGGFTLHGILLIFLIMAGCVIPNLVAWFLAYLQPLKNHKQTWGMRMFGLKMVHELEESLSWKTALLQEGLQSFTVPLVIGVIGVLRAAWDPEEKTFFNKISGLTVTRDEPGFKFVKEFREFRNSKIGQSLKESK